MKEFRIVTGTKEGDIKNTTLIARTQFDKLVEFMEEDGEQTTTVFTVSEPYDDFILTLNKSDVTVKLQMEADASISIIIMGEGGREFPVGTIRRTEHINIRDKFIRVINNGAGNMELVYLGEVISLVALN